MTALERKKSIIDFLEIHNAVPVRQMAEILSVSEMTVRRDIADLREDGIAAITSGVIFYQRKLRDRPSSMHFTSKPYASEKEQIGRAAVAMIEPGDVVFFDVGDTVACTAGQLEPNADITAVCFTMNALTELKQKNVHNLIVCGGFYHPDTQTFESDESIAMMDNIRASKVLLSAAGASMNMGLTCYTTYAVRVKRTCISRSVQKILLIDHSKFDQVTPGYYADWNVIDTVITDRPLSDAWTDFFQQQDIRIVVADK